MRVRRRLSIVAVAFLSFGLANSCLSICASAQPSDQSVAERILGPRWKQLSRRSGMIFAGTVLAAPIQGAPVHAGVNVPLTSQSPETQTEPSGRVDPGIVPGIQIRFRVDKAIAGVERGQILTIHEWAGASSMHRPMNEGQHILIFLYPVSRMGFTSPVGGSLGQVALDASGRNVAGTHAADIRGLSDPALRQRRSVETSGVTLIQLERAIRSAREE